MTSAAQPSPSSEADPWQLLLALAAGNTERQWFRGQNGPIAVWLTDSRQGFEAEAALPAEVEEMLSLYAPLVRRRPFVLGHLGQSIDGFIAGADGESNSLNGEENIVHLHRLRALFDVVMVGSTTACVDDPRLTTRLVSGPNPTRVVVDPTLRCDHELGVFVDGAAPTIIVCGRDAPSKAFPGGCEVLRAACTMAEFQLAEVMALLSARGLDRIFIEGGGQTVSLALQAGALNRLHVAVAPLFIGEGVRGVQLDGVGHFAEALRPRCRRFSMGQDVLFDFELEGPRV